MFRSRGRLQLDGAYCDKDEQDEGFDLFGCGTSDIDFDRFYVYGSWMFAGKSRSDVDRKAEFGRITPKSIIGKGGSGA